MAQKIENIDDLKTLCKDAQFHDCYISINGIIRSSKSIIMNENGTFSVVNNIDKSKDLFSENELLNSEESLIGIAIKNGQFNSYYNYK